MTRFALVALIALAAIGCRQESRIRTALDVMAQVVDPAYEATMVGCIVEQQAIVKRAIELKITPAKARALLEPVRARCHKARDAFEAIRRFHDLARDAVEEGELERAESLIDKARDLWNGGDS